MRKLEKSYGKKTFNEWNNRQPEDLRPTQTDPVAADKNIWEVSSFQELLERVAFLSSMNKRLILFYRGQTQEWDPVPTLFRSSWKCFGSEETFAISHENRRRYWDMLEEIGQRVCKICDENDFKVPRRRGLQNTREIQWAIIQHYGLWPTPLIDVTSSLHIAAAFVMGLQGGSSGDLRHGFLYVVGMPHSVGSITFNGDEHITLARLQSICPPVAKRPHYQEGFLMGHFPVCKANEALIKQSNIIRRLVVKFKLKSKGDFWGKDFPRFSETALLPEDDLLLLRFHNEFGPESRSFSLYERAQALVE